MKGTSRDDDKAGGTLLTDRAGYLRQRLDGLDENATMLENVQEAAPTAPAGDIRNQLARFLLRGDGVNRPVHPLRRRALPCVISAPSLRRSASTGPHSR